MVRAGPYCPDVGETTPGASWGVTAETLGATPPLGRGLGAVPQ